jgi:hypothetical protein
VILLFFVDLVFCISVDYIILIGGWSFVDLNIYNFISVDVSNVFSSFKLSISATVDTFVM